MVKFDLRQPPGLKGLNPDGSPLLVEYVAVTHGSDVVHRVATDADRETYPAHYREFKTPTAPAETSPAAVIALPDQSEDTPAEAPQAKRKLFSRSKDK